jgi:hypothetical protein
MSRTVRGLKRAISLCDEGLSGRVQFRGMAATIKPYVPSNLGFGSTYPFYYITGKPGAYRLCAFKQVLWPSSTYGALYYSDGFARYMKDIIQKHPPLYLVEFDKNTPYSERGYVGYGMTDKDVEWFSHKMGILSPIPVSRFGRGDGYRRKKRGYSKNVRHH